MHDTAYKHCVNFVARFLSGNGRVLDVGSLDVNGTLKPIFNGWDYTGMDRAAGKNVDVIIEREFPFEDQSFDVVVSSSALEHDPIFWVTFKEMVRVSKSGGFIYINVPSATKVHRHPVDCWRFFPDCWIGLEAENDRAKLVDSYIDAEPPHHDNVAIFAIGDDFVARTAIPLC
jgi:SAM-dependent methyltransferase